VRVVIRDRSSSDPAATKTTAIRGDARLDGPGRVTVWTEPGLLACEVEDQGHITDPLAGRRRPSRMSPCGRGLLLVNQLCDLVRLRSGPDGTSVRLHMALPHAG